MNDLRAWTMGPALLQKWPEFYGDIPSLMTATMPMDRIPTPDVETAISQTTPAKVSARGSLRNKDSSVKPAHQGESVDLSVERSMDSASESRIDEPQAHTTSAVPPMNSFSHLWDARGSNTVPDYDWLWLADNLSFDSTSNQ